MKGIYAKGRRFELEVSELGFRLWFEHKYVAGKDTETECRQARNKIKDNNLELAKEAAKKFAENDFQFKGKIAPFPDHKKKSTKEVNNDEN